MVESEDEYLAAFEENWGQLETGIRLRQDVYSVLDYVERHHRDLDAYLTSTYPRESLEGHRWELLQKPYVAKTVIENFNTPNELKWELLMDALSAKKPTMRILYVLGGIGEGKTTLAYDAAHGIHERSDRPVVAVGGPTDLPDFMEHCDSLERAPHGAVVVLDEAAANAGARTAMSKAQRVLPAILATIRHRDLILIVISQNSALADKTFLVLANCFLVKRLSMMQSAMERRTIGRILHHWKELLPRRKEETFILSQQLPPMQIERDEPEWYSDTLSRAYRRLETPQEIFGLATKLRRAQNSWAVISSTMAGRWERRDGMAFWKPRVIEWNGGVDPITQAQPMRREAAAE